MVDDVYQGVYFTPNPVVPDLLARAHNRLATWADKTTNDPDIAERRWLLIDVDPIRPSGISASDAELARAFKAANRIANMLELENGWPRPFINASGNGIHVMYAIQEPNTEFVRDEIAMFLKVLNVRFKDNSSQVDVVNYNAARIWRVPGTWARKGDNVPDRPHRKAHLLEVPPGGRTVSMIDVAAFNKTWGHLLGSTSKLNGHVNGREPGKPVFPYPDDEKLYRSLNTTALLRLPDWVPEYYPGAREYKNGYRVASDELGTGFEEDLAIHGPPFGIKYFGIADQGDPTEGRRTPVGLLAETHFLGSKQIAAARLSGTLKVPTTEFDTPINAGLDTSGQYANLPGVGASQPRKDALLRVRSMGDLMRKELPAQNWIIDGILPVGNILLTSRPKMKKTFLALQLAIAVSTGGKFLGWDVRQGEVLFLGLEDNERRMQDRVKMLTQFDFKAADLSRFRYITGGMELDENNEPRVLDAEEAARAYELFPRGTEGVMALDRYLTANPDTRMVVIDTLALFRDDSSRNSDVYQREYGQMSQLTRLAAQHGVLILVVHHEKKGLAAVVSGDFMEDVSGSAGNTGGCDGVMSIKGVRGEGKQRKLMFSGRDVPNEHEIDMAFDTSRGGWLRASGGPDEDTDIETAILDMLGKHPILTVVDLQNVINAPKADIMRTLTTMKLNGVLRLGKFGYQLASPDQVDYPN